MSLLSQRLDSPVAGAVTARPGYSSSSAPASCMASLDLFIVNVALPQIAAGLHEPNLGDAVLGAERLRDHLRGAAGAGSGGWLTGTTARTGFLLGVAVFTAGSAACGAGSVGADADRVPAGAGRRRGAADTHLARAGPGELFRRTPWRCGTGLDRGGRDGRLAGSGPGRIAGRGQLALGVPGECADRAGRHRHRVAAAARRPRPRRPSAGRALRGTGDRRDRRAEPGPGPGRDLGLDLGGVDRGAGRGRDRARPVRAALPAPSQPADRACPVPGAQLLRARRSRCSCSRFRSGRCCCRSCCGCRMSGAGRRCGPAWPSRRAR